MLSQALRMFTAASVIGAAIWLPFLSGCSTTATGSAAPAPTGLPGAGQQLFDSDDQAAAALVSAAKAHDTDALGHILGPSTAAFMSGDKVEDANALDRFAKNAGDHMELEKKDAGSSIVDIGADKWPFPIPVRRLDNGKWFFDSDAGKEEILARRIGSNELETIRVCRAYVEAQLQYATEDHDGSGVYAYAQHFISHKDHDGLYWPAKENDEQSPLGELVAKATLEGYTPGSHDESQPQPYHGYLYHILTAQGPNAPGGKYNYIINGKMIAGFGLVACPADYGNSGVMTFLISHQAKLYQKDLGPDSARIARGMKVYNPDSTWTLVKDQ